MLPLTKMLRVTDFSQLTPGAMHLGKEARRCPHCGKVGLFEPAGGKETYIHSKTTGFDDQGNFVNATEQCTR